MGELTGAWQGNDSGVYYIRHVGDCVWWFGTEVDDIEPGVTGQPGFANVAAGRMAGTEIDWNGPTFRLVTSSTEGASRSSTTSATDTLTLTEQRGGGQRFGGTVLTRIQPEESPDASPSASASP